MTRPREPAKKGCRVLVRVVAALLCLVLLAAGALWFMLFCPWGLFGGDMPYHYLPQPAPAGMQLDGATYAIDEDVLNILLIGVDERNEGTDTQSIYTGGYADVLMLCSYNLRTHTATLLPVPRDTIVPLGMPSYPGADTVGMVLEGPVCLAHGYGKDGVQGAQLTAASVSALFYGIPIHRFVSVHMAGIRAITDYLGGISVEITGDFSEVAGQPSGSTMVLDGEMAEFFVRGRSITGMTGGNLDRMVRQRRFLFALLDEVKARVRENPAWALGFAATAMPYLTTDFSVREMAHLAANFTLHDGTMQLTVMDGEMSGDVYIPNEEFIKDFVREHCLYTD